MYSLLIETSTDQNLLAILKNRQLVFQGNLPPGYQSSKYLLPEIDRGLKLLSLQIQEFKYIAVGVGPGSYTGIRVGVITAKTLAFAAEVPLIGTCTLEAWTPTAEGRFAVLIDAKVGGAYVITGEKLNGTIRYLSSPQICELSKLGEVLTSTDTILTPKQIPLIDKINTLYPRNHWTWEEKGPDPLHMDSLAYNKYDAGNYSSDVEIMYMRKTQAEIEREIS